MQNIITSIIIELEATNKRFSTQSEDILNRLKTAMALNSSPTMSNEQKIQSYHALTSGFKPHTTTGLKPTTAISAIPLRNDEVLAAVSKQPASNAEQHGVKKLKTRKPKAIISPEFIEKTKEFHAQQRDKMPQKTIADQLGITPPTLRKIIAGYYDGYDDKKSESSESINTEPQ